jgi:fructokinase
MLDDKVEALQFGAISLIPDPCGSTYESLMRREHGTRVISLDPNIRPGFITDPAAHRARIDRMIAMSDIIKMSDEDLEWFGLPDMETAAGSGWAGPKPRGLYPWREGRDWLQPRSYGRG